MLRAFSHRVATCCDMLGVVGSSLKMVKFEPTTSNIPQHVATRWPNAPNNVAICWVGMLRSFGQGLSTWRPYCNPWLTNQDENYNPGRTFIIDAFTRVQIPDGYKLMSFDVKSLFTSIPLQLTLQCTKTAIQQSTVKLPLPTEDTMDLLNHCLTSTYLPCNLRKHDTVLVRLDWRHF